MRIGPQGTPPPAHHMPLTPSQIATATGSPLANVEAAWPLIVAALIEQGIWTDLVEIAVAATVAVETGNFKPVRERMADPKKQPDLAKRQGEYAPYTGRGYVQLTWKRNYEAAKDALGVNLTADPDLALDPVVSARILAWFFKTNRVHCSANNMDWRAVRRLVNGGYNGWPEFWMVVCRLTEAMNAAA